MVILGYVLLTLLVVGYRFGDGDQNSHIPFLNKYLDPELYPNNSFIDLRKYHFSYFWMLLAQVLKTNLISMEILFFIIFIVSLILLYDSLFKLLKVFVGNHEYSLWSLAIYVLPAFSFTIFPTHENYLVDRVFVFPFLVYSLVLFLRNRYWQSLLLLGIIYNLHPLSATFLLVMYLFCFSYLLLRRKKSILNIMQYMLFFVLSSLPVFLWKFGNSGLDFSIQREWFIFVSKGVLWQVFHPFSIDPPIIILSVFGLGNSLVMLWTISKSRLNIELKTKLLMFLIAIYSVLTFGIVSYNLFPFVAAVQFQLIRIGVFIPVLAYPVFVSYMYVKHKDGLLEKKQMFSLLVITCLSGWLVIPWLYYLFCTQKRYLLAKLLFAINMFILLIILWVSYTNSVWKPGIYIYPIKNEWLDIQLWAKNNTNKADIFITPVDKWTHYYPDFIVFSERSNVVTLGELFEIAFHPSYIDIWKSRFEDLVPGTIDRFFTNFNKNRKMVSEVYNQNSTLDFVKIGEKYGAKYVVVDKFKKLNLRVEYVNNLYTVYNLK